MDSGALQAMANDDEVGALTGDGDMHSQLAIATESTGAAALWAGEIAKIGAVTGRGVGVAIIDSGVEDHSALAGRILVQKDFTGRKARSQDNIRSRHARRRDCGGWCTEEGRR